MSTSVCTDPSSARASGRDPRYRRDLGMRVPGCFTPRDRDHPAAPAAPAATAQPAAPTGPTRMERDLLGEKAVPADAYYGVQTARALENFQISGIPINHYPGFVEAWAIVKLAAARANTDVGAMKQGDAGGDREGRATP